MNIPKYSKLFIQIARETSVRKSDCPGNVRYPLSTWVLKACIAGMSTIIAKLMNASLNSVTFPSSMKHAVVRPIVKQEGQHPLTGRRVANFRLLANQSAERRLVTQ